MVGGTFSCKMRQPPCLTMHGVDAAECSVALVTLLKGG